MTCDNYIHVNDKNTRIIITITEDCVAIDISDYDSLVYIFTKPDGTILEVEADFFTDGTDGKLVYSTVAGDIDQAGLWQIQAKVGIGAGTSYNSEIKYFTVKCNLNE